MRRFGTIGAGFWIGATGRKLRSEPNARMLALYLMSSPHANNTGLYYLPVPMIQHEIGSPFEGASKGLTVLESFAVLEREEFAYYDTDHEVVWVPEMARYQVGESLQPKDRRSIGIMREIERWRNHRFYREFFERYSAAYCLPSPYEGPSNPLRTPSEGPEAPSEGLFDRDIDRDRNSNHPSGDYTRASEAGGDLAIATTTPTTRRGPHPSDVAIELTAAFVASLEQRHQSFRAPTAASLARWQQHMDLILRVDKRTPSEITDVIAFAVGDDFWTRNVLSTVKLRKHFTRLVLERTKRPASGGAAARTESNLRSFLARRRQAG